MMLGLSGQVARHGSKVLLAFDAPNIRGSRRRVNKTGTGVVSEFATFSAYFSGPPRVCGKRSAKPDKPQTGRNCKVRREKIQTPPEDRKSTRLNSSHLV